MFRLEVAKKGTKTINANAVPAGTAAMFVESLLECSNGYLLQTRHDEKSHLDPTRVQI
jgi:hypothetical protein